MLLKKGTVVSINRLSNYSRRDDSYGGGYETVGEIVRVYTDSCTVSVSWYGTQRVSSVLVGSISAVSNSLWLISDITVGRVKGTVEAPTRRAALIRGNKKFGWDRFHRAQFVHTL